MVFWIQFCSIIQRIFDKGIPDNVGFYFMVIAFPALRMITLKILQNSEPFRTEINFSMLANPTELLRICCWIMHRIDKVDILDNQAKLEFL